MKQKPAKKGNLLVNINKLIDSMRWTSKSTERQHIDIEELGKKIKEIKRKVRSLK